MSGFGLAMSRLTESFLPHLSQHRSNGIFISILLGFSPELVDDFRSQNHAVQSRTGRHDALHVWMGETIPQPRKHPDQHIHIGFVRLRLWVSTENFGFFLSTCTTIFEARKSLVTQKSSLLSLPSKSTRFLGSRPFLFNFLGGRRFLRAISTAKKLRSEGRM
jgi:hypothetical protein